MSRLIHISTMTRKDPFMKKVNLCLLSAVMLLMGSCIQKPKSSPPSALFQISTIDALLAGCYDGVMPIRDLHRYGNFGIGTYEKADGEMIMLNDTIYQIKADGTARTSQLPDSTPFATVIRFHPDTAFTGDPRIALDSLRQLITRQFPNLNLVVAVKISGRFERMKTRSVPPQEKPYRPLNEVVATQQKIRDSSDISGTVVGFYLPAFVKGINVPGYHLHFISDDRKTGGHLFECILVEGTIEWQICHQLDLMLPNEKSAFGLVDFTKDRSGDLQKVIKLKK